VSRLERVAESIPTRAATLFVQSLTLMILVWAAVNVPAIRENTDANVRTDDLVSCRATYRADVDNATVDLAIAEGAVQDGIAASVVASIRQDPTVLGLVADQITAATESRSSALVELRHAADEYSEAVDRSVVDPDLFLTRCKENP